MGFLKAFVTSLGGRRFISGLGGVFVVTVASYRFLPLLIDRSVEVWIVLGLLAGVPGLVLLYGGYRLPRTSIHPEFYATIGTWCLRGIVVGLGILVPVLIASDDAVVLPNVILLTALGSLAGFGAGSYDAQAKTQTRQLRETVDELRTSNERLKRYRQYTDDVIDAIDDIFYVVTEDGDLERWNESLSEVTGYTDEEIASMTAADFFEGSDSDTAIAAVRDGFETGSTQVGLELRTKDGDTIPFEFNGSTLENPSGETVLAGVGRDVSDRVEREQQLEELVEKLEVSNERLEQFAYAASHDLQEPLRMVSSYLKLIEARFTDDLGEEGQEFLEFAVDGADRMRKMIEGLLEYSRVETRGDSFEPVDLNAVLDEALDDLQIQIRENDAEITVEDLPVVEGDASQLRQVFQNLLANAIEYCDDESPQVHISAERVGSEWRISVRDEGIGIDPAYQDRIFDLFQRLHTRQEHDGTGIGLALCDRIVERHGGEIQVESEPGEGATFTVSLPPADPP